ncbi:MAG: sugar ABC transporter permease [Thermococcus sp.]|uniref:ABC transporter permease n=1 Tax=Thermococcus guaymasensis DSM 11113 TaxID=1432656 RepID=A0A0X1KL65_9EURY|nr:sugar ABC transporter permease [Thermococcus guaymasensis]AJC71975.1 ABC transporter permease [Thermococcus guaymasensis DSM 11113]MCD6524359.1 sugar ABC transporter permease [Thermococcus sp.]
MGGARYPEEKLAYGMLSPMLAFVLLFIIIPVLGTFWISLHRDVTFIPGFKFVGLDNYINVLSKREFWYSLFVTVSFSLVSVGLETVLGLAFALILNERMKGRGILRAIVLIPWAVPTIISARTWELMYNYSYGLFNWILNSIGLGNVNWLGSPLSAFFAVVFADVWKTTPFMTLLLLAGLQAIPGDTYEAAIIDGANMFQRFRHVTLPLLRPVLIVAVTLRTIDALRVFDVIYVLTGGGPGGATMSLSMLAFNYYNLGDYGVGSAISIITFLTVLSFTVVYLKVGRFQEGLK